LHFHEHYISIHNYMWLYIENEEEIEVEEARTTPPPPEEPQAGNCFYCDICGADLINLSHKASPGAFATSLLF
jgi:hypothetical protein